MLKITLPRGIERVGFPFHLDMAGNRDRGGRQELALRAIRFPVKDPVRPTHCAKVPIFHPVGRFRGVSPASPLPQSVKDCSVDRAKGPLADDMLMVACPSANDRIESRINVPAGVCLFALMIPRTLARNA